MRVGLLATALPNAKFVLVARRPVPTISSMVDAWRTERFAAFKATRAGAYTIRFSTPAGKAYYVKVTAKKSANP